MFRSNSYRELLKELYDCKRLGIRPSLPPVRKLLSALGDPHKSYRSFHIAGTNGKGSTTGAVSQILIKAGYRVGSFYSPHVADYRERIQLNGQMIKKSALKEVLQEIGIVYEKAKRKGMVPDRITFFEWTTAIAFYYFAKEKVDVAVMETGMGGRFDATNVITPLASIITNISLEHSSFLGDTRAKIAFEKSGIIKRGRPVICGERNGEAMETISAIAKKRGCPLYVLGREFDISRSGNFTSADETTIKLIPAMPGSFQRENSALAVQAVLASKGLPVSTQAIEEGIAVNRLPGRFEQHEKGGLPLIYDVAHNAPSMTELAANLEKRFKGQKFRVLFGVLRDKDFGRMLKVMKPFTGEMLVITPKDFRAVNAEDVLPTALKLGINAGVAKGKSDIRNFLSSGGPWVVTGSFTTVEAAQKAVSR